MRKSYRESAAGAAFGCPPLPSPQVNDDEIGESRLRENLRSDDGTFLQEYFVYCKKK